MCVYRQRGVTQRGAAGGLEASGQRVDTAKQEGPLSNTHVEPSSLSRLLLEEPLKCFLL